MSRRRDIFMNIYYSMVWMAIFYGLSATPAVIFSIMRLDMLLLFVAGVHLCCLFIRLVIKPVIPMFIAHLAFPVAAWFFAPALPHLILYLCIPVVLVVFSLYQRYSRALTFSFEFAFFASLTLIALALFLGYQGHAYMYAHYAAMIIFVYIGGRLHIRMTMVNASLDVISQNSTQPIKKIMTFDYKAMLVLVLILVGLIMALYVFLLRPSLEGLVGLIPDAQIDFELQPEYVFPPVMPPAQGGSELYWLWLIVDDADAGPALIWVILDWVLVIALPIVIVPALGVLTYMAVRHLYRKMKHKKADDRELDGGYEDIKEFINIPWQKRQWRRGPRNEHKIRRLFRETITRHMKKGVPIKNTDTPAQMTDKIQSEDIGILAEEYAAVRYK